MTLRCSNKHLCSLTSLRVHSSSTTDLHTGRNQDTAGANKTNNGYALIYTLALRTALVCRRQGRVCKRKGVTSDPKVATVCLNHRTSVVWNGISKPAELEVARDKVGSENETKEFNRELRWDPENCKLFQLRANSICYSIYSCLVAQAQHIHPDVFTFVRVIDILKGYVNLT